MLERFLVLKGDVFGQSVIESVMVRNAVTKAALAVADCRRVGENSDSHSDGMPES